MDFGPFGFIEKFEPLWNMWTGGGEHFGFLNQPEAGAKNFEVLALSLRSLLIDDAGERQAREIVENHRKLAANELNDVWRRKMGLSSWSEEASSLPSLDGTKSKLFLEVPPPNFSSFLRETQAGESREPPIDDHPPLR